MTDALTRLLLLISNALLVPVIVALLALFAWTLVIAGGFLKELFERRRVRRALDAALVEARGAEPAVGVWSALERAGVGLAQRFVDLGRHGRSEAVLTQALARLEHDIADVIARQSFVTRVSPMLGLMGTLIPLGPALSGLSSGDMASLADNLIVAFTATVVGLLISGVAFGIGLARRAWYGRDLTDLEFVAKRLAEVHQ
jgi:biopolymer transport protein ExbB/TolQ